jgi:hypothetical protein
VREIPLQYMIKLCSILGSLDRAHEGRTHYVGYSSMYIFDVGDDMYTPICTYMYIWVRCSRSRIPGGHKGTNSHVPTVER